MKGSGSGGMGDLSGLLKQAHRVQEQITQMQGELAQIEVEGVAGDGQVRAVFAGNLELKRIHIDRRAIDASDPTLLEDLVAVAVRQGLKKAQELARKEMGRLTGGLNLPGLF
ncbi:MAG: YbaB/EbfC family nucleoid-associated protein [Planctomycetota bacterium]